MIFARERRKQFDSKTANLENVAAKLSALASKTCNPSETRVQEKWANRIRVD